MAKTACEEAAERFGMIAHLKREQGFDEYADYSDDLAKRLRAEGRKIVRYERLILKAGDPECAHIDADEFEREAKRLQKARTKK